MKEILRKNDLKATKGRIEVLKLMEATPGPLNAEDVYSQIPRSVCSSLSTVYRILNQLTEVGLLRGSLQQNGITYYEFAGEDHHHYIVCSQCGKIATLEGCPVEKLDAEIQKNTGYRITGHVFQLKGLCPDCQKKD